MIMIDPFCRKNIIIEPKTIGLSSKILIRNRKYLYVGIHKPYEQVRHNVMDPFLTKRGRRNINGSNWCL